MAVVGGGAPKRGSKGGDGKKKKGTRDLKPKDAADAAEWTQESTDAAGHVTTARGLAGLTQRLPSQDRRAGWGLGRGAALAVSSLGLGAGNRSGSMRLSGGSGLRERRQVMPGRTANDTHSNAEDAAKNARSHTVYDGSSGIERFRAVAELLSRGIGSKVERFQAATCI
jgi:hypothetical protein